MVISLTANFFSVTKESMSRLMRAVLAFVFLLWLLPLGIFIAPSKEKLLCDGQRAICLCSHAASLGNKKQDIGKTFITAVPAVKKESSSGHYFQVFQSLTLKQVLVVMPFDSHENFYRLLIGKSIDHVPKV